MTAFLDGLERIFAEIVVSGISKVLFFDLWFWDEGEGQIELPFVVAWLVAGAVFFTLRFQFINFRGFRHSLDCVRGLYTHEDEQGEISHFQALAAALSATVGLGNIAGVAFAVGLGGPGAIFWMVMAGLLGMSSKFVECSLGQKYKIRREDGHISGGPMHYLRDGLAARGQAGLGRLLAVIFALMCIGGSFGGGNMFQSNQSYQMTASALPILDGTLGAVLFGGTLAVLVGLVIVGGIKRIGEVAGVLVPVMCFVYVACGLAILLMHADRVPAAFGTIVGQAFSWEAGAGGFVGTLIQGFRRAAFSNEAGTGSASIAHSAAVTDEPIREGMVALLEPFIDTIIVCTMTGLVITVTGAWQSPEAGQGIEVTAWAFATVFPWFPYVLTITAVLFAFSTMISWSYYGEQCWVQLFGLRSLLAYKGVFLLFVWAGAIFQAQAVLDFGDLMILGMAVPNIAGLLLLSGEVKRDLDGYLSRLRAGELEVRRQPGTAAAP